MSNDGTLGRLRLILKKLFGSSAIDLELPSLWPLGFDFRNAFSGPLGIVFFGAGARLPHRDARPAAVGERRNPWPRQSPFPKRRGDLSTGYGLRFSTEIYGSKWEKTVFHEYVQEACFVLTEISENIRKPLGVYKIM